MLKTEELQRIAKVFKISETDLKNAIESKDEVELKLPELNAFTKEELETRDKNIDSASYERGKTVGIEMLVKDQKEKLGLDFEGKTPEKLLEEYSKKILADAKIEPSKKLQEQEAIIQKLQGTIKDEEAKRTSLETQLKEVGLKSKLKEYLPQNRLDVLSDDEYLEAFKREYSIVEENGTMVVKKGDSVVRDERTQSPLDVKDVINGYFTTRKWVSEQQPDKKGRGDDNKRPAGVYTKLSEIQKEFESQGKSLNGQEFQAAIISAQKANASFDLDS